MATVYQQTFDCTDLSRFLLQEPGAQAPIEVFRIGGITPGSPDMAAATYREQFQITNTRVHSLLVGSRYTITITDFVLA
jgi:hypothetical protein